MTFAGALGRGAFEIAADLGPMRVDRAEVGATALRHGAEFEGGAVVVRHFHVGTVADEVGQVLGIAPQTRPVGAGDGDVPDGGGKAARAAAQTVLRKLHGR